MKQNSWLYARIPTALALTASPLAAHASDPRGLVGLLYGALAVAFAVVFSIVWFLTRRIARTWLKVAIRLTVVFIFWTPVPIGGAGYWWPAILLLMGVH